MLASCAPSPSYYVAKLERDYGIKYLSEADIAFFYENISGMDTAGVLYYVFEFKEYPIDFFEQFENAKDESDSTDSFKEGKNPQFEEKVETLIDTFMKQDYEAFDEKYQIDWDKEYLYKNNTPDYVTLPMIYFKEDLELIIIELQS